MSNCVPGQAHHWVIEPAQYRKPSQGVCKHCGLIKDFQNFIEDQGFQGASKKHHARDTREDTGDFHIAGNHVLP